MSVPAAVVIDSLVKRYDDTAVVDQLSFTVPAGTISSLLGPNGAGKTTTVECCEGFRRPDSGSVRVLGLPPTANGAELRPKVGVMLQEGAGMYPGAQPVEMLRHLAALHAHPLDVDLLADRLALERAGSTPIRRLSGGQRQRVALAAALVGRPELVFLDEPTAGLDPQTRHATWELMDELRSDGVTVVLTTHLIDEAERLSDHVGIIDQGRLVGEGSPAELTGGDTGVVLIDGAPGLDLSSLRAQLPGHGTVEEITSGKYRVRAEVDPHLLAVIASWCAENGIATQSMQMGRRSLEDVYLELTGRMPRP
ncbi:MAG TPA: ABC transporter ATP-binding protein [Jiangellaceae bacterium]|nr:ABC transporter ATP-binding protein [Jiangellaceae bacterium]